MLRDCLKKREKNIKYKKGEIDSTLSMEGIRRENQIQILTQTPFFMPVLGRVMLDSLRSRSST